MNTFRLIAVGLFLTALFAVSAFAQAAQPAAGGRIVYVNVAAFDDAKGGINKYVTAMNVLEGEFRTVNQDLQSSATRLQTLQKDIQTLQDQASGGKVPVDPKTAQAKVDEFENLKRDYTRKQEDSKAKFQSRYGVVVAPIMQDIMKSMQDFAKQKGYSMILDAAKLDEAGIILAVGNDSADVTKDFITFYNARPAGTAATAPR